MSDLLIAVVAGLTGLLTGGLTALRQFPRLLARMSFAQREQLYAKADAITSRS
jgi:hypothetical protein